MFSHLKKVCLTYSDHFYFSLSLSAMFTKAAICSCIHAFIPDLFVSSSSEYVKKISLKIKNKKGCHKTEEKEN